MNYSRKCPGCEKELLYKTIRSFNVAEKKQGECKSCSKSGNKNPQFGNSGEKNPFFGRNHTEELKKQFSIKKKNKKIHTEERKNYLREFMTNNNPMAGKSFYEKWLEKYGKEEADKKMIAFKEKQSVNNYGKNNSMYGKPSPQGSGNGWSGWYKGWYFRSIHELSFMIKYVERFNFKWKSAECNEFKILYKDCNENIKNYFPDFILNEKYLIECKPKKLKNSKNVLLKKEAAQQYCKKNNLIYKIISPILLSEEILIELYKNKEIIFIEKYEKKFIKKFLNKFA